MEQGSVPELVLTRSVIKHIRKHDKGISTGVGVGHDFSVINGDVTADGAGDTPFIAWTKALNNISMSKAKVYGARLFIILPDKTEEEDIKEYMNQFNALADSAGISILGGHTDINSHCQKPRFYVTMLGKCDISWDKQRKKISAGDSVIMVRNAGIYGTNRIISQKRNELFERFSPSYIKGAEYDNSELDVSKPAALIDVRDDIYYMHDVSHGGIYGGLWQLAKAINKGIRIIHSDILIRQETVEICEYFDINPYLLDGTGAMLLVGRKPEDIIEKLKAEGITSQVVGSVTDEKERVVLIGNEREGYEKRFLTPVKGDEIYKIESC